MASATTQSIGPAIANILSPVSSPNPAQAADRNAAATAGAVAIAQATQVASDKATTSLRRQDKDRSTQTPKRSEASFAPQSRPKKEADTAAAAPEGEGTAQRSSGDSLDVVA